ncbi:hypothetical protein F5B21DRAFT_508524 [Xylaria acuta]|nr:hypothetical protein F5B21DRAFT_508524 [Xylaria acuta]
MSTRPGFIARRNSNNRFITDHYVRRRSSSPGVPPPRSPPLGGPPGPPRNAGQNQHPGASYWDLHRRWEEGDKEFYRGSSDMRALLTKRQVDGIIDPSRNTNITIHLELELYDDLDEKLEQLAYLSRLGHFAAARKFFTENLQDQIDRPYVVIQYGELLLSQGDYKTLEQQNDPIHGRCSLKGDDITLLLAYWDLMQHYAISHKPRDRLRDNLAMAVRVVHAMRRMLEVKDISSTQIKFLALATQIASGYTTDDSQIALEEELDKFFQKFSKDLYETLLQQGRVWDMHDLMISLIPFTSIGVVFRALFGTSNLHQGIRTIISDWTEHSSDVDIPTNLALLGLLTSVIATKTRVLHRDQAAVILQHTLPLATSIMESDPKSMKSRPFVRWILEKARIDEEQSSNETEAHFQRLQSSIGVAYNPIRTGLTQYAPLQHENPGWNVAEASPKLKGPVRLGLQTAQEMGDYEMQVLSLQLLIRFSADPRKEFEDLCYLHKSVREDYRGYIDTLVSSYLVSETKEATAQLNGNLSAQIMGTNCSDYLPGDLFFMANFLLHSLPGGARNSRVAFKNAQTSYTELNENYETLAVEITRKVPGWDDFAARYEESISRRAEDRRIQRLPSVERVVKERHVRDAKNRDHDERSLDRTDYRPFTERPESVKRYDASSDSWETSDSESDSGGNREGAHQPKPNTNRERQPDKHKTTYVIANDHLPAKGRRSRHKESQLRQTAQRPQQAGMEGARIDEPEGGFHKSQARLRSKQGADQEYEPEQRTQRYRSKEVVPGMENTAKNSPELGYVQPTVEETTSSERFESDDGPVVEEVD